MPGHVRDNLGEHGGRPLAIDEGLVEPVEPVATVRIHLTNCGHIFTAEVPVKDGKAQVTGQFAIEGRPGTGAKITLDWSTVTVLRHCQRTCGPCDHQRRHGQCR